MSSNPIGGQGVTQTITVSGVNTSSGVATVSIPAASVSSIPQWMARLKMEPGVVATTNVSNTAVLNSTPTTATVVTTGNVAGVASLSLAQMDCYEDMFKEITKKLYGEEGLSEVIDVSGVTHPNLLYDPDAFRTDGTTTIATGPGTGLTLVTTSGNGLPHGTIVVQRRVQDEKSEPMSVSAVSNPVQQQVSAVEERWFDSEEILSWTSSKIARYNPTQKVFRCVDCDFVGFLSRVAEHWLGNHASLRVFQCPRCPYTSAWARCVRMHLTRQHGETLTDNSLWKENPVLEEVTKFLNALKTKVEQKGETTDPGAKRYACPYCPYATDRRDLFNRHENIHRDEKPFQCYVCDKQFNRADHVKKHFMRMHRDHNYDINRIRKNVPKSHGGAVPFFSNRLNNNKQQQQNLENVVSEPDVSAVTEEPLALQLQAGTNQTVTLQQIPHIAYFNPPVTPGQTGPLQGIPGVGGTKKEAKAKGAKKKKSGEKMYTCSYCPWQGVDNWCLKRHLNTHIKPFLCALCDYKAARSERLATHVLKVHNKRVCHKCSYLADDMESLTQHIQDSHQNPLVKTGFNCNVCQEYFELRADLEAHAILEHQKVIVQCDLCDFRTTDELSMESHLRDKHNLQPGMGAVAAAAAAAAAAAGTTQQIQLAPQQTIQIQALQEPVPIMEQHQSDPTIIVPDQVDTSIIDEVTFNDESVIQKMDQTVPEGAVVPEVEPETLCEPCGYEFANEASYKIHEKLHEVKMKENVELKTSKNVSRTYCCSTCSYTSATKNNMLQHLRAHTGFLMECRFDKCQYASPFENHLKEHIHSEHQDDNNCTTVRCPHCGVKLNSMNTFTLHWRFHHKALCSLCVNVYKAKFGMKEAGIHDLVLKNPLHILNGGVGDTDECDKSQKSEQVDSCGVSEISVSTGGQKIDDLPTQRIEDAFMQTINGLGMNNNKDLIHPSSMSSAETQLITSEGQESLRKKARLDNQLLPSLSAVALSSNVVVTRETLKFLPKLLEVLVVPLHHSVKKDPQKNYKTPSTMSVSKYPYSCYKEPYVMSKHFFNSFVISRKTLNMGVKCHRLKCRSRRFRRKLSYHVHYLWNHCTCNYKCDNCEEKFRYFYQAFLHNSKVHPSISQPLQQQQQQTPIQLQIQQHSFPQHIHQLHQ